MGLTRIFQNYAAAGVVGLMLTAGGASVGFAQDAGQMTSQMTSVPAVSNVVADAPISEASSETSMRISGFDPHLPLELILAFGGIFGIACGAYAMRRHKGALMYAGVGGAISLALMNPQITLQSYEAQPTTIAIVTDQTSSQSLEQRSAQTALLTQSLAAQLGGLENVDIRMITVEDSLDGQGTSLFGTLQSRLSDVPTAQLGGVFVLTDGQISDLPANVTFRGGSVPLHALISGTQSETDRLLTIERAPAFATIDRPYEIQYQVRDLLGADITGDMTGDITDGISQQSPTMARVRLLVNGEVISEADVETGSIQSFEVNFDQPGHTVVTLETDSVEGELTAVNNTAGFTLEASPEQLNILYLSGMPNQMDRAMRSVLRSDPDNNVVHFSFVRDVDDEDMTPLGETSAVSFPAQSLFRSDLSQFDAIIMNDFHRNSSYPVQYLENVAGYVRDGGALFFMGGEKLTGQTSVYGTALAEILPGDIQNETFTQPYNITISEAGVRHPVSRDLERAAQEESWGPWITGSSIDVNRGQTILETTEGRPLLVLDNVGEGRVATLLSDNAWLWARDYQGGGPFADLITNVNGWLVDSPAMAEEALLARQENDFIVISRQTMDDNIAPVTMITPDGARLNIEMDEIRPGLWEGIAPHVSDGMYTIESDGRTATMFVAPATPIELRDVVSTHEIIAPLVQSNNGQISRMFDQAGQPLAFTVGMPEQASEDRLHFDVRHSDTQAVARSEERQMIPDWGYLLLIAGLWAGALLRQGNWQRKDLKALLPSRTEIKTPETNQGNNQAGDEAATSPKPQQEGPAPS